MCHSKELIFLYSAYTDRLILFYDIDNSYIIKTLRGDAHAAIRKIEGRMDMKKLRNCSILCCFTIAACGLGKSREADKLYINHRLIFETGRGGNSCVVVKIWSAAEIGCIPHFKQFCRRRGM